MKKRGSKKRRRVLFYVMLVIFSVVLFQYGKGSAYRWRGYRAVGGEYMTLLYPVVIYFLDQTYRDWGRAEEREKKKDASR